MKNSKRILRSYSYPSSSESLHKVHVNSPSGFTASVRNVCLPRQ